ncbi:MULTISPECIES: competence/damage-inducible protein A [unclassified Enterococcus]|uniref:competence/damage-inducible protein A n=1 Tax=unclassified Enterococcus TaxID=2608891 RepID=UPI001CE12C4A|nr:MULTISPECIES: competence/damage-inducible protein A [unclassified Enterococcus]MCA5014482.1 competence/damage-inducible protein A [Enterococcus sp. S23]MCA5017404.1 competence/damage-inducible protein A [Enterococcus sp. S22(2020)]
MKAEIIAVGTELLLGQVVNTNATFLSEELADLGIEVYYHTVVGDNPVRLDELLTQAQDRSDLIVLCGGLGPTDDDLTKDTVAAHIHHSLIQDEQALRQLNDYFSFSKNKMTENNLRQTLMIEGGRAIQNPAGLAVGTLVTENDTTYLLLPGPPNELKPMFKKNARPLLEELFPQKEELLSRVLRFYGIGESQLVTELKELIDHQSNPTIAPYAKPNEVTLRLTAKVADHGEGELLLNQLEAKILSQVGDYFYGYGDENSLVEVTVEQLKKAGKTVSAAESLTAGLFQSTLGDVPGVSEVFKGGFVTYSVQTKEAFLGIDPMLLEKEGVVSEFCAIAMAEQARILSGADFAVSFTGVAGPDELEGHPAGTVWIGLAEKGKPTIAELQHFTRDRRYIRRSAVMKGLDMIRRAVDK